MRSSHLIVIKRNIFYLPDADGNRLGETKTADDHKPRTSVYTYPVTSNQLTSIAGGGDKHAFTYDAAGNTVSETGDVGKTFTYDARNRNSVIDLHGDRSGSVKYLYNALGERVSKDHDRDGDNDKDDGPSKDFIYDEQSHLIAQGQDTTRREYVYLNDLPIALVDGKNILYIHTDQIGTPQKMTNADQKVVWDRVAEPFGEAFSVTGPAILKLRFPG